MYSVHLEPPLKHQPQLLRLKDQGLGICFRAVGRDPWQDENHLLGTVHAGALT